MTIVVLLVLVAAIGAVVVILAGRTGGQADFAPDRPSFELPPRDLTAEDVDGVRFAVGVRGYRMDQVDVVMDRLAAELTARDLRIAALEGGSVEPVAPQAPVVPEAVVEPAPAAAPDAELSVESSVDGA